MNLRESLVRPAKIASTLALWAYEMGTANGLDLMSALQQVADPRWPGNGTRHDFQEILVMAVCAVLSDCDTVEDIAEWAAVKEPWLHRFLVLPNGVPSQDTFLRIFRLIDPKQFEAAFRRWVGGIVTALGGQIAIDGKSLRGSADAAQGPVHMVSAFHINLSLVLGKRPTAPVFLSLTQRAIIARTWAPQCCVYKGDHGHKSSNGTRIQTRPLQASSGRVQARRGRSVSGARRVGVACGTRARHQRQPGLSVAHAVSGRSAR